MSFDEQLQQVFDALTARLHGHLARELAGVADELKTQADADRDLAATEGANDARADAERTTAARLTHAEQAAAARLAESMEAAAAATDARVKHVEQAAAARLAESMAAAAAATDVRAKQVEQAAAARLAESMLAGAAATETRVKQAEQAAAARLAESMSAAAAAADARVKQAEQAAARLTENASAAEAAYDVRVQRAVDEAIAATRAQTRAADLAAGERLLAAIRAIDSAKSLSEILDTLASTASGEASRVGVLLVRGEALKAWRLVGFGPGYDTALQSELALDASGVIGEAVRSGAAASSETAGTFAAAPFELPDGRLRIAVPIPMSGQVVAVLYADQGSQNDPQHEPAVAWPATLDVLVRHAARSLEALTAFKAARVLTEHPNAAASAALTALTAANAPAVAGPPAVDSAPAVPDRSDDDEAARRYARLLVSEIKLYNEPAVAAGRRDRDLGTRLAPEISRARALYEQRVPVHVREHTDHFHAELVRTLANGDARLLSQPT